jgi:hypothetical protein
MAATQADIDALTAAIASGEKQVTIGSQSVSYRTIDDLIKARDTLMRDLAVSSGATARPRQTRIFYAGRGYDR